MLCKEGIFSDILGEKLTGKEGKRNTLTETAEKIQAKFLHFVAAPVHPG